MALIKELKLDNGITLNYHRVVSITETTNVNNIIEIKSYLNKEQRLKEKEYQILEEKFNHNQLTEEERKIFEKGINLYVNTFYYTIKYNDTMTIQDAYEYLKTTDGFKNAEDDLED